MRRNALHPKGTSFGARLLTPCDKPRYALSGLTYSDRLAQSVPIILLFCPYYSYRGSGRNGGLPSPGTGVRSTFRVIDTST
jgi:hypothetical protein